MFQVLISQLEILSFQYGLPQWLNSKESACSAGDAGDVDSIPGWGKSPGANYFLPGESPGQRSLAGIVHGITESDTTETT